MRLLAGAVNGSAGQGAMGEGCGVVYQSVMLLVTSKLIQGSICFDLVIRDIVEAHCCVVGNDQIDLEHVQCRINNN